MATFVIFVGVIAPSAVPLPEMVPFLLQAKNGGLFTLFVRC